MTRSEFFFAVDEEFGPTQGRTLLRDLILSDLGNITASSALDEGIAPKRVWESLCAAMDVPVLRRHGAGLPAPTGDTPA